MLDRLDDYLIGIVIGIRFRPNFSIEDQLGRIVDDILYGKDQFFGPKVFPVVQTGLNEKVLANEDTGDSLHISNSNIVLQLQLGTTFKVNDVGSVLEAFEKQIIKGTMNKHGIRDVARIGLVKRHVMELKDLADSFVDKTIGKTLEGVNDINLRFSKKLPVPMSLVKEAVNDYFNAIFNIIKKADRDEIFISVDFQQHFNPVLSTVQEMNFKNFISEADSFSTKRCLPWLKQNYLEGQTV